MLKRLALRIGLVLAVLLPATPAMAWWEYGHGAVGRIAYMNINPQTRVQVDRLLRQGRLSLAIGIAFLALCLLGSELLAENAHGLWSQVLSQSLTVAGWVAMWRPLQVYLYDWWPVRRRQLNYRRLSRMPVEIRPARATSSSWTP